MYPDKKICIIVGGVVIFYLVCESFEKDSHRVNKEHVHVDYSHLANAFTTSSASAIVTSAPSGDFGVV